MFKHAASATGAVRKATLLAPKVLVLLRRRNSRGFEEFRAAAVAAIK